MHGKGHGAHERMGRRRRDPRRARPRPLRKGTMGRGAAELLLRHHEIKSPQRLLGISILGLAVWRRGELQRGRDCIPPGPGAGWEDLETLNCLGVNLTRIGRHQEALSNLRAIQQINCSSKPSYCNRIIAYTEMGAHDDAR